MTIRIGCEDYRGFIKKIAKGMVVVMVVEGLGVLRLLELPLSDVQIVENGIARPIRLEDCKEPTHPDHNEQETGPFLNVVESGSVASTTPDPGTQAFFNTFDLPPALPSDFPYGFTTFGDG
jgi:hypothetical protein